VLKPRDSPEILVKLKPSPSLARGRIDETVNWRGIVGSAGVVDRGKGTGWIAWEPERSRSSRQLGRRLNIDPAQNGIGGGDHWPCLQYPRKRPPGPTGVISASGQ
jgi:hypothetical protein